MARTLRQAFGLTFAEARAASLVGSGLSPQEATDQLGNSVGTIRSELKKVLSKLDIPRQSELATAVARIDLLTPGVDTEAPIRLLKPFGSSMSVDRPYQH